MNSNINTNINSNVNINTNVNSNINSNSNVNETLRLESMQYQLEHNYLLSIYNHIHMMNTAGITLGWGTDSAGNIARISDTGTDTSRDLDSDLKPTTSTISSWSSKIPRVRRLSFGNSNLNLESGSMTGSRTGPRIGTGIGAGRGSYESASGYESGDIQYIDYYIYKSMSNALSTFNNSIYSRDRATGSGNDSSSNIGDTDSGSDRYSNRYSKYYYRVVGALGLTPGLSPMNQKTGTSSGTTGGSSSGTGQNDSWNRNRTGTETGAKVKYKRNKLYENGIFGPKDSDMKVRFALELIYGCTGIEYICIYMYIYCIVDM